MKLQKTFAWTLLAVAALAGMAGIATAQVVVLDDFSTGPYQKTLTTGFDQSFQAGAMIKGGERFTTFFFCLTKTCAPQSNPYGQAGSFQISPATPTAHPALIYSAGYKATPELVVIYGQKADLNLKIPEPTYDRLRLSFDGNTGVTNFLIYAASGSTNQSTLSCHIFPNPNHFTVDLPYANFLWKSGAGVDFSNVSAMSLVFTDDYITGGNDWAITKFEAIPKGAPTPPGTVLCNNH